MGGVSVVMCLVVRTARAGLRGAVFDQADDPFHVVQGIGDTSSHRRGQTAKALVLTAEVVMDEVQRQHVEVVLQLLAESVGQAGEPTHTHPHGEVLRSEEHTSELQSLMRISYAVFCLKTKNKQNNRYTTN